MFYISGSNLLDSETLSNIFDWYVTKEGNTITENLNGLHSFMNPSLFLETPQDFHMGNVPTLRTTLLL